MNRILTLAVAVIAATAVHADPLVAGLNHPTGVTVDAEGRVFATTAGDRDKKNDGAVVRIDNGKPVVLVPGLNQPVAIVAFRQILVVAERHQVIRIDDKGKVFPLPCVFPPTAQMTCLAIDAETGGIYVGTKTDDGAGQVYRVGARGKLDAVPGNLVADSLAMDGQAHLLVGDAKTGSLARVRVADGARSEVMPAKATANGLAWDYHGQLFIADRSTNQLLGMHRPGDSTVKVADGFKAIAAVAHDPVSKRLIVADRDGGTLSAVAATIPGYEVDTTPLALRSELAFPNLKWEDWEGVSDSGQPNELRPILLTHAGDGSNRNFIVEEHGRIFAFANDPKATEAKVFLDIRDRVSYINQQNEEGLLGLAFHPKYKDNGEFFVFYTPKKTKLTNVVSRFRVRKDDPNRADPASEEVLMTFTKPYWNHDGGTLCFGPDGYLYITHGDGGAANDPHGNASNLGSLLGKIHRIDVNKKDAGRNYAIPKDNPFVDNKDAKPEIWAYGLRNLWRMAFDRRTGQLWAADVGQNLYEEINIIERGRSYGWNPREGRHPFGNKGVAQTDKMAEPIWEYHHDLGKSITGGHVYRGTRLPELDGHYLYADYVSGRVWALKYDEAKKRVVANRPIPENKLPVFSFGEDEAGDAYWMTATTSGQGIYRFAR